MRHIKRYEQLFESAQELSQEQRDWLDKCTRGSWKLNPETGLVDVTGNFFCHGQDLDSLGGVRFGTVSGDFYCRTNSLTFLEGAPQSVGGDFICYENSLTSLEGAPQSVGGDFSCSDNELKSLEGAPQIVGRGFFCYNNELKSLEGAPQSVGGDFNCNDNKLKSLEGAPQRVGGFFRCSYNELTSLEGAPQSVGGGFSFYNNPISERTIKGVLRKMSNKGISLEEAVEDYWKAIPEEDRLYLAKHHPGLSPEDKRGYEALLKFRGKII